MIKRKARLVVGGHRQEEGVDYNKTFYEKYTTLRMFCAIACVNSTLMHQRDFERAFAYAPVDEDIYVRPHPEMRAPDGMVCKVRKLLYGLKQAPRNWNEYLHSFLEHLGFTRSMHDTCLYTRMYHDYVVLLAVFVDDVLIACAHVCSRG